MLISYKLLLYVSIVVRGFDWLAFSRAFYCKHGARFHAVDERFYYNFR